jgi:hypothetical protein
LAVLTDGAGVRGSQTAWVLALLAFGVIAVLNDFTRGPWLDEAYTLATVGQGLAHTLRRALHFEGQPPLYFLAADLWTVSCSSLGCARLLSTACALGVIAGLAIVGRQFAPRTALPMLPVLGALSPMLLWAASLARGYALTALLVTVSLMCYLRIWGGAIEPRPGHRILHVLVWCLGLSNFYFFGFIIAGQAVGAFLTGRERRTLWFSVFTVSVLLGASAPLILRQIAGHEQSLPNNAPVDASSSVEPLLFKAAGQIAGPVLNRGVLVETKWGATLLLCGLLGLILLRALTRPFLPDRAERLLLPTLLVPMVLLVALKVVSFDVLARRHTIILLPGLLSLLCLWLSRARQGVAGRLLGAGTLVVFLGLAAESQIGYLPPGDWSSADRVLRQSAAPGEPLLVFPADNVLAYRLVATVPNPAKGLPREPDPERWSLSAQLIVSAEQADSAVSSAVEPGRQYWLLVEQGPTAEGLGLAHLGEFLRRRARQLGCWEIPGNPSLRLYHLERAASGPNTTPPEADPASGGVVSSALAHCSRATAA